MYDLVIQGGLVVDGSGLPPYIADIGISGDRIAHIGRIREPARRTIQASGHIVTPGFIDGHTHYDAQLNWDPLGTCSGWHGVTTAVMGNCGFTLAPVRPAEEALVVRNLERAEDLPRDALDQGIRWNWETIPQYLDHVDRLPKGINYAVYAGHSALRTWAMGERAFTQEANADDIALMAGQLDAGLRAGAIGFSTSRSAHHETSDDRPVASRTAAWSEIKALCDIVGRRGGMFELALAKEAREADPESRRTFLNSLKDIAVETGAIVTYGTLPAGETSDAWRDQLATLSDAAAAGGRMVGQSHSRGVSILLSFESQLPFDRLPEWKDLRSRPLAEQAIMLRDPACRAVLVEAATHGDYGRAIGASARKPDWDLIKVYSAPLPPYRTIAEIAAERGVNPVEAMIDVALEADLKQFFISTTDPAPDEDLLEIMRHPHTVMTFSDAGAHVGQIVDACIQSYLIAYWALERGAFSLAEAVRMVTLEPARAWGFSDRGLLREGMIADINVIDPARLSPGMPALARDLPAGAMRLVMRSEGFAATIVSGQVLLQDGVHGGALPGRLLRRQAQGV